MEKVVLKSIGMSEKRGSDLIIEFDKVPMKSFNLLISDNAQGKTRLLNMISFVSKLANGKGRVIPTEYKSRWEFLITSEGEESILVYSLNIKPESGKNIYDEEIILNDKLIFSSQKNILLNEENNEPISNYYIPENLPAIVSLNDKKFKTIGVIRDYFQRIVFVSSNKGREILVEPGSITPNMEGTNISSVLETWLNDYPGTFSEVLNEFKQNYTFIEGVSFTEEKISGFITTKFLEMRDREIIYSIKQREWSDGLIRFLFLLMSTKVPFKVNGDLRLPSLVLIDEVENGLDFKSLKNILSYLYDHSDDSQIMITSHSPLVCEFISPHNWIIVKRSGNKLDFISPAEVDKKLDNNLELFKHKHWDFYTKHISNSNLYLLK